MIVLLNGKLALTQELGSLLKAKIPNSIIVDSSIIEKTLINLIGDISKECFANIIINIISEITDKKGKNVILIVKIDEVSKLRELYDSLKEISWNIYKVSVDNELKTSELVNITENILGSIYGNRDEFFNKEFLQERNYILKTNGINLKAANSSHQTLSDIQRGKDFVEAKVQTHPLIIRQELELEDLQKYLKLDNKVKLQGILEKVLSKATGNEGCNFEIDKIITGTRELDISYDEKIYGERKTNMFIQCMRNMGIPTKYVLGKSKYHKYQAWAETYIDNIGWVPVDVVSEIPNDVANWYFGITNKHIKLFEGISFEELKIDLEEFEIEVYDVG